MLHSFFRADSDMVFGFIELPKPASHTLKVLANPFEDGRVLCPDKYVHRFSFPGFNPVLPQDYAKQNKCQPFPYGEL